METKNIVGSLIGITVAVLMVAVILVPIVDDATGETTFSNVKGSYGYMTKLDSEESYSLMWDTTNPEIAVVNGEETNLYQGSIVFATSEWAIRYGIDGSGSYIQSINVFASGTLATLNSGTASGTYSVTYSGGVATVSIFNTTTGVESSAEKTFNSGYAIAPSGEYVMKSASETVYLNKNYNFEIIGATTIDVWNNLVSITGTIDDLQIGVVYPENNTIAISNVATNAEDVNGYTNVFTMSKITFDATKSDGSETIGVTYSYFVVPAEITGKQVGALDDATAGILKTIPILVIVGIVIAAVGMIATRERD